MLRKLNHPNIVKMHALYELEDQICIVMEYLAGKNFLRYVTSQERLSEREVATFMKQLLLVLHYLESMDVLHRDIKMENIILVHGKDGKLTLKLIDFGLSIFLHQRDLIKRCGTPGYVAPEILNGERYDFKVDLYSTGVVMFIW